MCSSNNKIGRGSRTQILHGLDLISLIRVSEVTGVKSRNVGVILPYRPKLDRAWPSERCQKWEGRGGKHTQWPWSTFFT